MGVAEHREQRHAVAVVDRVIAPNAARDVPAVEAEQLVQFGTGEIQRSALRPIIPQRQHRRTFSGHRYHRRLPLHAISTISAEPSSRLAQPGTSAATGWLIPPRRQVRFASPRSSGYGARARNPGPGFLRRA